MHLVIGEEDLPEYKRTGYSEYLMEQQEAAGEQAWEDRMLGEQNEDQD